MTPSVSSGPSNILSPSLASEMESLSLANDVPSAVITPVSLCVSSINTLMIIENRAL